MHGSKYIKYNGPHKTEYYMEMAWCCKANFKINSSRLKIKKTNLAYTPSSISTAKGNIKQIIIHAHSENINSIKNGIQRSIRSSIKKRANQFTQL